MSAYPLLFLLLLAPSPSVVPEDVKQAAELYQHGHFRKAADLLSSLSQSSPDDAEIRVWLGKSLLKLQKWDDAVREIEVAVRLQPANATYYLWLGRACGHRASHSQFLTALGWAKKVAKAFEKAQELAPDNLDVRFDLMDFYLNAPGIVGGGRDKSEAEAAAIEKLDPSKGYLARASLLEKDKNWDQARIVLSEAVSRYPEKADCLVDLADFLLRRQQFEAAAATAQKALSLDANSATAKLILAEAQIRLGKCISDAESALTSLSKSPLDYDDPTFEAVYYWLGEALLAEGKTQEAREAFRTSLRYNPDFEKTKNALSRMR